MNLEKVVFGFFVLLAATLNFGFFIGDLGDPELHNSYELYAAVELDALLVPAEVVAHEVYAQLSTPLLDSTLLIDATRELVLHGRHVPSSWIWRRITRRYT